MALDDFTGTNGTAAATHDPNWTACTVFDGAAGMVLDGSGNLIQSGSNFGEIFYNGNGTGANSVSHITIPAGCTIDAAGNLFGCGVRMNTAQQGYYAFPKSSTNVNTNWDQIGVKRNGSFMATVQLDAGINLSSVAGNITIRVVNTVDIEVVVSGRTYTKADNALLGGSGGNDSTGAAVLTGGFPGVFIYHNSVTPTQQISVWTDDVATGRVMRPAGTIGTGGMQTLGGGMQGKEIDRASISGLPNFHAFRSSGARPSLRV